jgi:hypothetical protein
MVLQGEAPKDEEYVTAPLREIGGLQVQNNGNEVPDVLEGGGLVVESGDGRGVRGEGEVVVVRGIVISRAGFAAAAAESGGALLQGIGLCALLIKGVDGGANPILGGGGGFEEVGILLKLVAALGVGGVQGGGFLLQ